MAAISSQQYWLKYFPNNNVVIAAKTNAKLCVSPVAYVKQLNKVEKKKMMPRGPIVVSVSEQEWTLVTHKKSGQIRAGGVDWLHYLGDGV